MENTKENKELVTQEQHSSPAEMIRMAVSGGADLDKLEKLLALQERWEANEARKAYHVAMSNFKSNPIEIEKDKKVGYQTDKGRVSYSHASLANVVRTITKELSKYGLSASWRTSQNGTISITCKVTHSLGHSEETTLSASSDKSGSKNDIQALGSTISYLERYSLLAVLGLATTDMDDDAAGTTEFIDEKQLHNLRDQLLELEKDEKRFLEYMGIESLEKMPKKEFPKAQAALEAARQKKKDDANKPKDGKK